MNRDRKPLEDIFALLDTWRHFPAYQLERRADIFFAVYLHEVMEGETQTKLRRTIIPELPLRLGVLWAEKPTHRDRASNQSVKVDYALFAEDLSVVHLVELKTDMKSRRGMQDVYLQRAHKLGFQPIVKGIRDLVLATSAHQKYHHLASALAELGFFALPPDLQRYVFPRPQVGLPERLAAIAVIDVNPRVEIHYLQPVKKRGEPCIDFATFANYVERHDDAMSRLFAQHLARWVARAGGRPPSATSAR